MNNTQNRPQFLKLKVDNNIQTIKKALNSL